MSELPRIRATTILAVRRGGVVALGGDGQVTVGDTVMKAKANKVRTIGDGKLLAGFAGSAADALTLFEKFEEKLKRYPGNVPRAAVELAKDWRSDRVLRNRWRRQQAPESIRNEIAPNNIILIGPTGVGKTEIARRLAKLTGAPFIKVEASKFTEVGYVGRDVEGMIRDLVDSAIEMVRQERESEVEDLANERVDARLLDLLLPPPAAANAPAQPCLLYTS